MLSCVFAQSIILELLLLLFIEEVVLYNFREFLFDTLRLRGNKLGDQKVQTCGHHGADEYQVSDQVQQSKSDPLTLKASRLSENIQVYVEYHSKVRKNEKCPPKDFHTH